MALRNLAKDSHLIYTSVHREFCEGLSKFIKNRVNPYVDEWENNKTFPAKELFREFGHLNIFGVNKPQEYGGQGLDFSYSVAVAETLGTISCGAIPMALCVQSDMATPALAKYGSDSLKREFLAPSISGDSVACIGVSEAGAGSDVSGIKTSARRHGSDLIINGSKHWITNGHQADWICLLANTNANETLHKNKSLICVRMDEPGVKKGRCIEKLGMHCSDTAEIYFENLRVPCKNIIGEEGRGFIYQMEQFQDERLVAVAVLIKPLESIISSTVKYTLDRKMFGRREWDNQVVQYKLAELSTELKALKCLLYQTTFEKINGKKDVSVETSMAKLMAGRLARRVTDECLQFWGGMGYTWENPIARYFRDFRLISIGAGCDEVMLQIIAKSMEKENL